jgi:hypothetical protein
MDREEMGYLIWLTFPKTLQHWIAIRCRSFSAAVGIGIVAMITGYIVAIMASRNSHMLAR